ncbi:MAG TPA: aminopeptidase P N-terminal domain-containing protein [Vicinamibacterales bacterium]|jgi:Xaa-Pro aminopeptidase
MTTTSARRTVAVMLSLISVAAAAHASDFSDDLKARRAKVMERLGPDAMLVLWSAPPRLYSLDVDYEYRQDSNLYYLTGLTQEDTCLILMPGNATRREVLFVRERNPSREHWTGHLLTPDEAKAQTGIDTVLTTAQFDAFVSAMLDRRAFGSIDAKEGARFFEALGAGRARVNLLLDPGHGISDPLTRAQEFARQIRDRFFGFQLVDAAPVFTELRTIKTPYERKVLVKDLEISSDAQMAGMRAAHPGAYEYEVKAAIEAVFRSRGSVSWSYPSIVGSGPNATILHYPEANRQMQNGELLLVDAAANYQYMSGDITRTYPVGGTFSPLHKDIYQLVLAAQEAGIEVARAHGSLQAIHDKTVEVIKAGLLKLGLITDTKGDQYRMWYTHGAGHYIGLDVHDVGDRTRALEPGMAFTIEPGIYIRQAAIDALPRTPENNDLVAKIQPAVTKYLDIGVRIEDSFLLDDSGLVRLSASVPRTVQEVEAFMKPRGSR